MRLETVLIFVLGGMLTLLLMLVLILVLWFVGYIHD